MKKKAVIFLEEDMLQAEIDDVRMILMKISGEFDCIILSQNKTTTEEVKEKIKNLEIRPKSPVIITSAELKGVPGETDFFRSLCKKIGWPPSQCYLVGSDEHFLKKAQSNSLDVIFYRKSPAGRKVKEVKNFSELYSVLRRRMV